MTWDLIIKFGIDVTDNSINSIISIMFYPLKCGKSTSVYHIKIYVEIFSEFYT